MGWPGSVPRTNGSGCRRPKNLQILRIRIRNTANNFDPGCGVRNYGSGSALINMPASILNLSRLEKKVANKVTVENGTGTVTKYLRIKGKVYRYRSF
jgi:hypothetical protein